MLECCLHCCDCCDYGIDLTLIQKIQQNAIKIVCQCYKIEKKIVSKIILHIKKIKITPYA